MLRLVLLALYLAAFYSSGLPPAGGGLDPNGLIGSAVEVHDNLDPNGAPSVDKGGNLDPDGAPTIDIGGGLDPDG